MNLECLKQTIPIKFVAAIFKTDMRTTAIFTGSLLFRMGEEAMRKAYENVLQKGMHCAGAVQIAVLSIRRILYIWFLSSADVINMLCHTQLSANELLKRLSVIHCAILQNSR